MKFFYWGHADKENKRILSGIIAGHNVRIYDAYDFYSNWVPLGGPAGGYITKRVTITEIDGKQNELSGVIFGFASVWKIKSLLFKLASQNRSI